MNTAIFHIVGGDAFFSGLLAIAAGAVVIGVSGGKRRGSGSAVILTGWVLIIASATAHLVVSYALLASVLFSEGSTLDSIHLSNDGHRQLAERVAEMLSLDGPE